MNLLSSRLMKKAVCLVLVMFIFVIITTTAFAMGARETEKDGYTIAVVSKSSTAPWFQRMETGVKMFAQNSEHNVFQTGPAEFDASQQVQVVNDLIAQGVDAICVVPIDPSAMEPVLRRALNAGIVVISHEASELQNTMYNIEAFTAAEYGAFMMDNLARVMGERGKYVTMVGSVTQVSQMEWADGAVARQKEAYPNMELIAEDARVESRDDIEIAYQVTKELAQKHPELRGILGTSSFDPPGAARAIEELGLVGELFVAGSGLPSENRTWLEKGIIEAVTLWDPADAGYAMATLAEKILDGKEITDGINLGIEGYENMRLDGKQLIGQGWITITKENVDEFGF